MAAAYVRRVAQAVYGLLECGEGIRPELLRDVCLFRYGGTGIVRPPAFRHGLNILLFKEDFTVQAVQVVI
ncbi:hypothetical protein ACIXFO_12665 [Bacteroides fragilis]